MFQILDFQENTKHIIIDMKPVLYPFLIYLFIVSYNCCSSDKSREYKKTEDVTIDSVHDLSMSAPTTIRENATLIDAIVDSSKIINDLQYELFLTITKASSIGALDNFTEVGQRIKVKPNYVLDDSHKIDRVNERNKRLLKSKELKTGSVIKGKISLTTAGEWILADIIELE